MPCVKVYPNEKVKRVIAFIPTGHTHVRFILEFEDQVIVLQEATVAALVRAYTATAIHPIRKGLELSLRLLPKNIKKQGFASYQLIETNKSEQEVLREAEALLDSSGECRAA